MDVVTHVRRQNTQAGALMDAITHVRRQKTHVGNLEKFDCALIKDYVQSTQFGFKILWKYVLLSYVYHNNHSIIIGITIILVDTIECRYNAVQYSTILHTSLQELNQNINQRLNPQKTPHA